MPGSKALCTIGASELHPLIVDWSTGDRASLESRLMNPGLVAVHYEGCDLQVLRYCNVPGNYRYKGLTVKRDEVVIHNEDELFAFLPIGAFQLRSKLRRAGRLSVDMVLSGTHEADQVDLSRGHLSGRCEGATHIIASVQVGAFEFFAGGEDEIEVGAGFRRAGAGVKSSSAKEILGSDGNVQSCAEATSRYGSAPPEHCGALLRVELVALVEDGQSSPSEDRIAQKRIPPPWRPLPAPLADPFDASASPRAEENSSQQREEPSALAAASQEDSSPAPSKPWKGLAIGAGISLAGSAAMAVVTGVGASRTTPLEKQFIEAGCPINESMPDCAEIDKKGRAANSMQTGGLITMPVLLGLGIGLLITALRRKAASGRQQAILPQIGKYMTGFSWEFRF